MESSLTDSILRVCRTLNKFSVEYMIVGGTAVALHGYYRHSMNVAGEIAKKPDLVFWYNPSYHNYFKLLNVLEDLGQDVTKFKNKHLTLNDHFLGMSLKSLHLTFYLN